MTGTVMEKKKKNHDQTFQDTWGASWDTTVEVKLKKPEISSSYKICTRNGCNNAARKKK